MTPKTIATFWGGPLTWLERLSLATMRGAGHKIKIFTHDVDRLRRENLPAEILDVRDFVPPGEPTIRYRKQGYWSLYADIVRLGLLKASQGVWADMDCIFLKELSFDADYVMGWVAPGKRINNGVLYMASGSEILADYWNAVTAIPVRAPWATTHVRLKRELGVFFGRAIPDDVGSMSIGPRALTYFVKRYELERFVSPKERFYPLDVHEGQMLLDTDDRAINNRIGPNVDMIHAWHGTLKHIGALNERPPASSWIGQKLIEYDV